jgi:hypothetical protein
MPPSGKLPDEEIAILIEWIRRGSPDPRSINTARSKPEAGTSEDRDLWSLKPLHRPSIPDVQDRLWPRSEVDRFILHRLTQEGIAPAGDADRETLIRRATFDLIGLPPTVEEQRNFLADESPDAFARLIDRLLASSHFGERWGRHWLDLARYAESVGAENNTLLHEAWRYRDYVISSFNADKPYDQFLIEVDRHRLSRDEPLRRCP